MRLIPLLACLYAAHPAIATLPNNWKLGTGAQWSEDRVLFEKKRDASLEVTIQAHSDQTLALILQATPGQGFFSVVKNGEVAAQMMLRKPKTNDSLSLSEMEPDPAKPGAWKAVKGKIIDLPYRPAEKATAAWNNLKANGLDPQGWHERNIEIRVVRRGDRVEIYFDGVLAQIVPVAEKDTVSFRQALPIGDALKPLRSEKLAIAPAFQPLALKDFVPGGAKSDRIETVDGIPFLRPEGTAGVDLRKAAWAFQKEMPSSYYGTNDQGPLFLHDLRVPTFWAPAADYASLHLLVRRTADDPNHGKRFSVRVGSFGLGASGGRGQVLDHIYHVDVPGKAGEFRISVPINESIAQDLRGHFQVSFNREMRLARRSPDPSRFEYKPIGLPPGVEILGATLERFPVQWRVTPTEPGALFENEKEARFKSSLNNTTDKPLDYTLEATAKNSEGGVTKNALKGQLKPGEAAEIPWAIKGERWGYHDLEVRLTIGGKDSVRRVSSFALLPPDTRRHREESPFGTWTFNGTHLTCDNPDVIGSLLKKAGLRYGMGAFPNERAKWGVRQNFEAKMIKTPEKYEQWKEEHPDALPVALLMHEHSISADQVTRVPDIFTERKPYEFSEPEKKQFTKLWDEQVAMAKLMREHFPEVHLRLGNGPLPTKEAFLREKFPAELFDSIGNEAGNFGRLPETQPPDMIANNASIWMDYELLKAYGYDKPVTQCYEITYPSTNPGNLSHLDQAAYFVRHGIHSLAWRIPEIRFGGLDDVANAYRFSNWGASGFVNSWPHLNPKPAIVAVSTMTRMLDGASYVRSVETGSPSVYAVEFETKEKRRVYALWTIRGERTATIRLSGKEWAVTDWESNQTPANTSDGKTDITLSFMPVYLSGAGEIQAIELGEPRYSEAPGATVKVIPGAESLANWEPQTDKDPILEFHNPITPRVKGDFAYAEAPGNGGIVVKAKEIQSPKALPMYGALKAKTAIELPGEPTEIGLHVEGKSNWGRIIFELEDASGQKWTSIGASAKGEVSEWMLDWLPAEFAKASQGPVTRADWNTNDVFGLSFINFDGWRYLRFPLPGNYPGGTTPWPANSQWRSDRDGVVHYPLKLTRLIFELPKNILKLTDFTPVTDPSITVKGLTVEYGTQGGVKQGIYENEP